MNVETVRRNTYRLRRSRCERVRDPGQINLRRKVAGIGIAPKNKPSHETSRLKREKAEVKDLMTFFQETQKRK